MAGVQRKNASQVKIKFFIPSLILCVAAIAGTAGASGKFHYGSGEGAGVQVSLPLGKADVFRVRHVVDGDTLELENGEKVRYIGIDTPEERRKEGGRWVRDPEPYAEEAARENRRLVEGKTVRLEFDREKRDKYGRLLAYVYVKIGFFGNAGYDGEVLLDSHEIFVNAYLIQQGLAKPLVIPPNTRYAKRFKKLALLAKQKGLGLYARER